LNEEKKDLPSVESHRHLVLSTREHANLIRELQRQESKLVIETVAADLLKREPQLFVLTLKVAA